MDEPRKDEDPQIFIEYEKEEDSPDLKEIIYKKILKYRKHILLSLIVLILIYIIVSFKSSSRTSFIQRRNIGVQALDGSDFKAVLNS